MKFLRYALITVLSLFLIVMITGLTYEQISRLQAHNKYEKNETFADVGGYKLHYRATTGPTPIVVFESGLDASGMLAWIKVQPEIAKFAGTFLYDRAGSFMSDRGDHPKNGYEMAKDLHTLLHKTGHAGPYILVGHSMAGIILRSFVAMYPGEVAGVVFVDASHPQQVKRFSKYKELAFDVPPQWLIRLACDFGYARLFLAGTGDFKLDKVPDSVNTVNYAFVSEALPGYTDEARAFSPMADSAAMMKGFGIIPLTVLTGTSPKRITDFPDPKTGQAFMQIWMELQNDHLKLSTNSKHILATNSTHYIQLDEPQLVIDAVHNMVNSIRK